MTKVFFCVFLLCTSLLCSQQTELARLEYSHFPGQNGKNDFQRISTFVDFPLALKKKGSYFIPRIAYQRFNFGTYDVPIFDQQDFKSFESFQLWLGYTFEMKRDWRFGFRLGNMISSNFEANKIVDRDIFYLGLIYFIKSHTGPDVDKPWRLIIALAYPSIAGKQFTLPVAYYYRKFDPKWSYTVGLPKSDLKHYINKRNIVQAFIEVEGFFSNIQNTQLIFGEAATEEDLAKISMRFFMSGLGYEHGITQNVFLYVNGGYTLSNSFTITDRNQKDAFTITNKNTFFIKAGISLKI